MDLLFWEWLGLASLGLAAVALVLGLARGQIKPGLSSAPSAQERLARYPSSARAVIIKAQRRRALWRLAPTAAIGLALVVATTQAKQHGLGWLCDRYSVEATLHGLLGLACYGLPALVGLMAAVHARYAVRVLRGGYVPPLDSVTLHDTVAVSGWRARVAGVLGLVVLPVLAVAVMGLGHNAYQQFSTLTPTGTAPQCPSLGKHP